jgi:hypothetical protein
VTAGEFSRMLADIATAENESTIVDRLLESIAALATLPPRESERKRAYCRYRARVARQSRRPMRT